MKKNLLLVFVLFLFSTGLSAQESLKALRSNVIEKINGKEYYIHTIKKGQTLYMISKAYGVDVNDVIKENPEVKEGIRADEKLRIPINKSTESPKKTPKPAVPQPKPQPVDTQMVAPLVEILDLPCGQDKSARKEIYNVALMLPLFLSETDEINTDNPPSDAESSYHSLSFIQFYEGFRIAVDSLRKSGIPVRLYIFDVNQDTNAAKRILRNPDLKKMDLIIGLLFHRSFQIVSAFALKNHIPLVNPVSERASIINANPYIYKVVPSQESQVAELTSYLVQNFQGENILVIKDSQSGDKEAVEILKQTCADKNINVKILNGIDDEFTFLSKEKGNVIIVFSENKVFALELFTKLNKVRNDFNMTLVGLPRWDKLEGLEPEYLVNLKTHLMVPSFVDYQEQETKKFVSGFQEKYKTDPDLLAFQGFDIAFYFISALRMFGKSIDHCIPGYQIKTLQSNFQFTQSKGNGFSNQHWEIFKYENYRLKRVGFR